MTRIVDVRAYIARAEGYGEFADDHWILGEVASPLSGYEEFRPSRATFGVTLPETVVVQIEAEDGTVGIGDHDRRRPGVLDHRAPSAPLPGRAATRTRSS